MDDDIADDKAGARNSQKDKDSMDTGGNISHVITPRQFTVLYVRRFLGVHLHKSRTILSTILMV